jgi:polyphosphate kinase
MATTEASMIERAGIRSLDDPALYCSRELSLLEFQRRVLEEVKDPANPLLERIKFLAILDSNIDEFFMVRVAGLKQQASSGVQDASLDGRSATEQLSAVRTEVSRLVEEAYDVWHRQLLPGLADACLPILDYAKVSAAERATLDRFFKETVFPVLTPLGHDTGRPFPHISSLSLNLAVIVKGRQGITHFARVKVPDSLPQLVPVNPATDSTQCFVWLEQIIMVNLQNLFPGMEIVEAHPFRITRDAEVEIKEVESDDLLETIEEAVWQRRFRSVVRLEVYEGIPAHVLSILTENLELGPDDIYYAHGPMGLKRLWQLDALDRPRLKYKAVSPFTPPELRPNAKEDIFALIRHEDLLLHHPFESFQPVVEFLRTAARDPDVLAIKMTLYRVGRNSPVVEALLTAVQEGKQVSVLVELKARFDEESNIEWARALESEGVHVVYGLVGLKVHSKIALVVRREGETMRKYVHLGTGNYNPATARLYTDLSLFTCDEQIGNDAVTLFNRLTGYADDARFSKLLVAPIDLRPRLEALIEREIEFARRGERGHIIGKMNALDDPDMIKLFYRASQAGVQVDLLVRGICCLRPGLPGVSDNIRVISIVGRFLEHSRIYWFRNGGREEAFVGSADLMPRNLSRRIEVVFPVETPKHLRRLKDEILDTYLADNVNARRMNADGSYERIRPAENEKKVDSQESSLGSRVESGRSTTSA